FCPQRGLQHAPQSAVWHMAERSYHACKSLAEKSRVRDLGYPGCGPSDAADRGLTARQRGEGRCELHRPSIRRDELLAVVRNRNRPSSVMTGRWGKPLQGRPLLATVAPGYCWPLARSDKWCVSFLCWRTSQKPTGAAGASRWRP